MGEVLISANRTTSQYQPTGTYTIRYHAFKLVHCLCIFVVYFRYKSCHFWYLKEVSTHVSLENINSLKMPQKYFDDDKNDGCEN